jgi:chemotaxis protein methyltransferase CheR
LGPFLFTLTGIVFSGDFNNMLSDEAFGQLLTYYDRPWSGYRKVRKGVKKRIRRRMEEVGCPNVEAYLELITASPVEKRICERLLLVTISRFFRDRQLWHHLGESLLPHLIEAFNAPVCLWSAGCACGEEAYSLAILWAQLPAAPRLELLATDMQPECLNRAKAGIYPRSSLKALSGDLRERHFRVRKGGRQFCIQPKSLPPIQWQVHNLFEPPPPGSFHLILLRNNLLTYHRGARLATALERIAAVMVPDGYLIVGTHEHLPPLALNLRQDPHCPWVYKRIA